MATPVFTPEEQTMLLEMSARLLADADLFEEIAYSLDLSDDTMCAFRDKVDAALKEENPEIPYLQQESASEYTLLPAAPSVWLTVDNLSVYVVRNDEGVSVDIFPKGDEDGGSIAGTWATYDEGNPDAPHDYLPVLVEFLKNHNITPDDLDSLVHDVYQLAAQCSFHSLGLVGGEARRYFNHLCLAVRCTVL